jgi:hypothetical protein
LERYRDETGTSGIAAFEIADDGIAIEFKDGGTFLYTPAVTGRDEVETMKELAAAGHGLNTFINKYVRDRYAKKLR